MVSQLLPSVRPRDKRACHIHFSSFCLASEARTRSKSPASQINVPEVFDLNLYYIAIMRRKLNEERLEELLEADLENFMLAAVEEEKRR
jgi:tRNA A-37 threonylcarbamoyl transferase component Bud32